MAACLASGCSAGFYAELPGVGMPKEVQAQARPSAEPAVYPAVHDIPPPRDERVLTAEEQDRLQRDLAAARDRQESRSETSK